MAVLFWIFLIRSVQNGSKLIKLVQIGDQIRSSWFIWGWGLVPHPCPILFLVNFNYWKTWLKLVMLENLQEQVKKALCYKKLF